MSRKAKFLYSNKIQQVLTSKNGTLEPAMSDNFVDPRAGIMVSFNVPISSEVYSQTSLTVLQYIVITGFNTDIDFDGVTYHVQTEDKGLSRPIILSLVYDRGTILASKRSPYDDLVGAGFDETLLAERLQKQHRLICAAISAGRLDDLKKMSGRDAEKALPAPEAVSAVAAPVQSKPIRSGSKKSYDPKAMDLDLEISIPKPDLLFAPIPQPTDGPIIDIISIIEDHSMLPDEAVAIVSDLAGKDRPSNNRLAIEFLGNERFKGGETKSISVMVCRGSGRKVVAGAEVMVKIIGSAFRPLIFHSTTDKNGLANVTLQFPKFKSGRAAFLVRAISGGEEIELRRPIAHG